MVHVSILALRSSLFSSIIDSKYVFSKVNEFLQQSGKQPLFYIQLVGLMKEVQSSGFVMHADLLADEVKKTDLIIIPSLVGAAMTSTHMNKDFAHWIAVQYKNGAEVASLCSGAFLLAFSGLLQGKQCTTHWAYANEFRYLYPNITLIDEKVITDQQGLYSSGGSNAYWNLLLHLVEKYAGREMAIRAAKYFVIDLDRQSQTPFVIFNGLKDHDDKVILDAQSFIEQNYAGKLTVEELAGKFFLSRRTFERRFKKATRNTVTEYVQRVKVEGVKKQLEIGRKSITEIMLDVGYSDIQTFREVFKRISGMTPNEYRNKYNKG